MVLAVIEIGGRQGNGLPAARGRVGKGRAGELGAGRSPEVEDVRAGVAGAAIEFESRDLAGHGGCELHAEFELAAVIEVGRAGVFDALNRLTGAAPAGATVKLTLAEAVPPRPSEIV